MNGLTQRLLPGASALDLRLISFGCLVYMFSGVGQSYFFQFIRPDVMADFGMTEDQWGTFYMLGTLASGFAIMLTGRIFDWFDLRVVTIVVIVGAAFSCFFFANVTLIWMLVPAIFLQRQFGQGLMSHVPAAAMSRYFTDLRGRATGLCNASYSAAEALLPQLAGLVLIIVLTWRGLYETLGLVLLVLVLPLALWLLRGHGQRHQAYLASQTNEDGMVSDMSPVPGSRRRQWTLPEVIGDPTAWMLMPTIFAPSFIFTGLVVFGLDYASELGVSENGWRFLWMIYALFGFAITFPIGWVVDRFTATRLAPFTALPMALALLAVQPFDGAVIGGVMLLLWSACQVFTSIVSGPLLAELYGVKHLGAIKSAYTSVMVAASAGGPFVVGRLLSEGWSLKQISLVFALYILAAAVLAMFAVSRLDIKPLTK